MAAVAPFPEVRRMPPGLFERRWKKDIQRARTEILKPRKVRLSMSRRRRERYRERRERC